METKTYRIRIQRGGEELEAEGDKRFVLDMIARFYPSGEGKGKTKGTIRRSEASSTIASGVKPSSAAEFLRGLSAKKQTDIVLAFAYYLEKEAGVSAFTAADIKNLYYDSKLESPNISQMLIQNIKRGYVMEAKGATAKGKKSFRVTQSGEAFVEEKLRKTTE